MNNSVINHVLISALSYDIGAGGVSNQAHILPAGEFTPDDGREMDVDSWKLSPEIASRVIAKMAARKNDTLIDYEHQSLMTQLNGQPVIAAGWFKSMEYREDGLWAINVEWTASARSYIKNKEYRYISSVFAYDLRTGDVVDILSITLTNSPAIDGLSSLAALTKNINKQNLHGDDEMSEKTVASLTSELSEANTKNVALSKDLATANTTVAALTADLAKANQIIADHEQKQKDAALATEKKAHGELLTQALSDGRLAPAQKVWAEKQSLAALTEYLDASAPILNKDRQAQENQQQSALTETELAMCSRMNVKPEDFAKIKAEETARKQQQA
ncbi:MAG: phage protease [Methylophilus sp.]